MKFNLKIKLFSLFSVFCIIYASYHLIQKPNLKADQKIILNTFYGEYEITEPAIIDVINHVSMQRLKEINQYGLDYYVYKKEEYSRYDHCVGVFIMAKRFGASLNEQIASLIHDISHTAFSHLGDYVFKQIEKEDSYQDSIHKKFIYSVGLDKVLNKHGIKVDDVLNKNSEYKILEQSIPDICADRLEYNLYGGYLENKLTQQEIMQILDDLRFENEKWYFINIESAKKFALTSLFLTETKWAYKDTIARNLIGAKIILRAFDLGLINQNDFHFGKDNEIWNILINSKDSEIKNMINQLYSIKKAFVIDNKNPDHIVKPKFRGIDPWVKTADGLKRLTTIDSEYKSAYERLKSILNETIYIKLL